MIHRIAFVCGDLLAPICIPRGKEQKAFDLLLSNPPYIVHSDIGRLAREVKHHEPVLALDGGEDGLDVHRRILGGSSLVLERREAGCFWKWVGARAQRSPR